MKTTALFAKKEVSKTTQKLLILDAKIPEFELLKSGAIAEFEIFVIDRNSDGIHQISNHLKQYPHPVELHLVSHGAPGCLHLGCNTLNLKNISHYSDEIKAWNLSALILYGCHVAAGDAGSEFIDKLYRLTGANIAASTTKTGHSALGGNWELEVVTGECEVDLVFGDRIREQWQFILPAFEEQPYFYQVISGELKIFNPLTNNYEVVGTAHDAGYNATGFNTQDNFIYGIEGGSNNTSGDVIRIHSDGTVEDVQIGVENITVTGTVNLNSGEVDNQGNLWVRTGNTELTRVNRTDGNKTQFSLTGSSLGSVSDIIFNTADQKFYGVDKVTADLYIIEIVDTVNNTGTISTQNVANLPNGEGFGAVWIDTDGDLYVSRNNQEELYRIDNYNGDSPEAIIVANSQDTSDNDGMSDPDQKSPFKVPFVDPNPDNTDAPFTHEDTFTEGESGVDVVSSSVDLKDFDGSVTESDDVVQDTGGNILRATITITNPQTGDELLLDSDLPTGITVSGEGSDVLIIEGASSAEEFETFLQAVQFRNTSDTPDTTQRDIEIQLTDTDGDDGVDTQNNTGNRSTTTIDVVFSDSYRVTTGEEAASGRKCQENGRFSTKQMCYQRIFYGPGQFVVHTL